MLANMAQWSRLFANLGKEFVFYGYIELYFWIRHFDKIHKSALTHQNIFGYNLFIRLSNSSRAPLRWISGLGTIN
jgi:hypothetical protein